MKKEQLQNITVQWKFKFDIFKKQIDHIYITWFWIPNGSCYNKMYA